jgi:hypothetical protein
MRGFYFYSTLRYNTCMENKTKRVFFGNEWFLPPFRTHGYWVEDATGKNVAEAASRELAKALKELLDGMTK